jgi:transposase
MRGTYSKQASMLSLQSPEQRVPQDHPLRRIKKLADQVLAEMTTTFDAIYSEIGRPSIPPERLLKAQLLMALYSVRSENQFCEQLDYNLLFRWFLDMNMDEEGFVQTVFTKNRDRLIEHDVAKEFFARVVEFAKAARLMSNDHFTVDGTLIDAWASLKSFKRKDGKNSEPPDDDPKNPTVNFHGEKRSNDTHASTTDPESKLYRKSDGTGAKLCYSMHALMENRNGLLVNLRVDEANGFAERRTALEMLREVAGDRRITAGADKAYDTRDFIADCRAYNVTPHVAQNVGRRGGSALDQRTTRHEGYADSQRRRKLVEESFGWAKTVGNFRRTRYKGKARTQLAAYIIGAAYNLVRVTKLLLRRPELAPA